VTIKDLYTCLDSLLDEESYEWHSNVLIVDNTKTKRRLVCDFAGWHQVSVKAVSRKHVLTFGSIQADQLENWFLWLRGRYIALVDMNNKE